MMNDDVKTPHGWCSCFCFALCGTQTARRQATTFAQAVPGLPELGFKRGYDATGR